MSELEGRLGLSTEKEKKTSLFGKGTFGRKLLLTTVLLAAGIAVGLAAGRSLSSLASI